MNPKKDLEANFYHRWKTANHRHQNTDQEEKLAIKEEILDNHFKTGREGGFKPSQVD